MVFKTAMSLSFGYLLTDGEVSGSLVVAFASAQAKAHLNFFVVVGNPYHFCKVGSTVVLRWLQYIVIKAHF